MKKVETIKFSSFFSIHLNISFDKLQYVFFYSLLSNDSVEVVRLVLLSSNIFLVRMLFMCNFA